MSDTVDTLRAETMPDPSLYNEDLAPVPKSKRTWDWMNYSTIWMGMVHNIVSYELAGNLIAMGMSVWQALGVVVVSNICLILALWFNGVAGAKYGLPFPVLVRASFGYRGAQLPVLIRAFVAIFWFAVNLYIGSQAVGAILSIILPGWAGLGNYHLLGMGLNAWISFVVFWLLHAYVVSHGMARIRHFELWAGPSVILLGLGLVIWAIRTAHGIGPLVSMPSTLVGHHFWNTFFLSVTAMIGGFATLVLNIPDLTRFSRSQRDQVIGQGIGLPIMMTVYSCMSVLITAGTIIAFGKPITDPVQLLLHFNNPVVVLLGAAALMVATISINVVANVVSPAYDLVNLLPGKLNFVKAGIISMLIAVFFAPWLWFQNAPSIFTVIGAIGGTLGPVAGIMIVDFFQVHRQNYDLDDFFIKSGHFAFYKGWNPQAYIALVIGAAIALCGLFLPFLQGLYAYNWFLGIVAGGLSYSFLMRSRRQQKVDSSIEL